MGYDMETDERRGSAIVELPARNAAARILLIKPLEA